MLVNAITLIIISVITIGSCQPIHFELLYAWQCNAHIYMLVMAMCSFIVHIVIPHLTQQRLRKDLW